MSKTGGSGVRCFLFRKGNLVVDTADNGKIKRWETKILTKLFCLKKHKEETWVDYQTRTSIMARTIWVKMKLPFP